MVTAQLFPREMDYSARQFPQPRAFQERAHVQLREGFRQGHRRQLLVAPTGSGKTYCGLRVCREAVQKGRRAVFVCDRAALIDQTSAVADKYGLKDHGIIQADHWRRDNELLLQIASIQTIAARGYWPQADVIIIDEAHTRYASWVEHIKQTKAAVIGLTATPCTKGLGNSFTHLVNAATMDELTRLGILVPMRILDCRSPDMTDAETVGDEWTAKAASERELKIVGDVVAEWQKHASHCAKTIAFGPDIAYCAELARRFQQAGIGATLYTSETNDGERRVILREFSKPQPELRVLVSVEALAKGFDVPDIGCVIDARPLRKSLSTAMQMWGRGARSSPATGKTEFILLSFSGNIRRFYDDFSDVYFNGFQTLSTAERLDSVVRKDEPDEFVPSGCPECGRKPFRRRCLGCGYEKPTHSVVDQAAGVMQEIKIGTKDIASDKQDLWNQLCTYAKQHVRTDKKAGWVWYKFQGITGEKPSRSWSFEGAPDVPITSGTIGKLKSLRIAYHKAREAGVPA